MSFDWLNVPGLTSNDTDTWTTPDPPPSVSFNLEEDAVDQPAHASNAEKGPTHNGQSRDGLSNLSKNDKRSLSDTELTNYVESKEDLQVPLSLSRNQLTREEVRTYLRWYGYIAIRKHTKLIRLDDVFQFLSNFPLSDLTRKRIEQIFKTCKNALNIGQFFAVLRLISRALVEGVLPTRKMLLETCPVPRPRPILTAGREEVYEEVDDTPADTEPKVDIDSFASLLLTGQRKKRFRRRIMNWNKKQKRVRFSDKLVTFQDDVVVNDGAQTEQADNDSETTEDGSEPLDLSLPMDQLLKKLAARNKKNSALVSKPPSQQVPETQEEKEVLEDMKESLNHFQQIQNVDSVSLGGAPAQIPSIFIDGNGEDIKPLEPLKPTATGSANYLFRSSQESNSKRSQPNSATESPQIQLPLRPTATGSANHLARQQFSAPQALPLGNTLSVQPLLQTQTSGYAQSPQGSQETFSTGTTAGSYFQSLLSNSPSPNNSSLHITQGNSRTAYNNGYQLPLQQQQQQQQQTPQQHLYPNYAGSTNMNYSNTMSPQYRSFTTSPVPQISPPPHQNHTPRDFLGDLRALKEQVDNLKNSYKR